MGIKESSFRKSFTKNGIEKIETFQKSFIKNLEEIEEQLDIMNATHGSEGNLCVFCNSEDYNTKVGIVHKEDCEIIKLRKMIKDDKLKEQLNQLENLFIGEKSSQKASPKTYWFDESQEVNEEWAKKHPSECIEVVKLSDMEREIDKNYVLKSHLKLAFISREKLKKVEDFGNWLNKRIEEEPIVKRKKRKKRKCYQW